MGSSAWDRLVDEADRVTLSANMPEKAEGLLLRYFVPGRPANLANRRMHYMERARVVAQERSLARLIGASEMVRQRVPKAQEKRKLVLTLMLAGRLLDADNAYSAGKPYADSTQDCGLIVRDDLEWCDMVVQQRKVRYRDAQGILVEVWRAD